jgi:hypothetical protein
VRKRNRRFRLIACAVCRDAWDLFTDERSRRAVEVTELFADGLADERTLAAAQSAAWHAYCRGEGPRIEAAQRTGRRPIDFGLADNAAGFVAHKDAKEAVQKAASAISWVRLEAPERAAVWQTADLIREVFGNPFRPCAFDPTWRTADVMALAQAAYDVRSLPSGRLDRAALAVLADALEDAGCTENAILSHLRGAGGHVRGCHAVDTILRPE